MACFLRVGQGNAHRPLILACPTGVPDTVRPNMPLNWGIIAPGGIVEQVFPVVWYKGSPNKLAAVASRDLARAKAFAETHAVEGRVAKAYGSYDELIADPNVGT